MKNNLLWKNVGQVDEVSWSDVCARFPSNRIDVIGEELKQKWIKWLEEMQLLAFLRIPRCLKPEVVANDFTTKLHLFADASELAYGAACYVRLK